MELSRGTLNKNECHPAADSALAYLKAFGLTELVTWQESFSSCAIEGNRLAEVCSETLDRLMKGLPVSDRYILGLAWTIKQGEKDGPSRVNRKRKSKNNL